MKEVGFCIMSVLTYQTARHHMSKKQHSSLKKSGSNGTKIIQRFPTVPIESTARHNENNP